MLWQRVKRLNNAANTAMASGRPYQAYRLKLQVVEEALKGFERSKDELWLKLAEKVYNETTRIRTYLGKREESNISNSKPTMNGRERELAQDFMATPRVRLDEIGGLEKSKEALREALEWPLRYRDMMKSHGLERVMKGCLLYGPPGCGKTILVEAVANTLDVALFMANPQNLLTKWFGSSERLIGKLFCDARKHAPSIIFIDEVDKILPKSTNSSVIPRVTSVFLQEMDGATTHDNDQVVVAMASNEPWGIKEPILRPGRCDRIVYIPPPDWEARRAIFKIHSRSPRLGDDFDIDKLVALTAPIEGWHYSGSDIMNICNTAKLNAMRREIKKKMPIPLTMKHFLKALESEKPKITPKNMKRYEEWGRKHASFIDTSKGSMRDRARLLNSSREL